MVRVVPFGTLWINYKHIRFWVGHTPTSISYVLASQQQFKMGKFLIFPFTILGTSLHPQKLREGCYEKCCKARFGASQDRS